MSVIIYQNPKDLLKIILMKPTGELPIQELIKRHITTTYKVCNEEDILHLDKTFIDSWQLDNDQIIVNMTNAKNQWRDILRLERKPILESLDIEYMRALEINDTIKISEIVTKKQKLRDAPSDIRIDQASTPNDLKNLSLTFLTS